jgi:hypothetical protein
MADVAAYTIAQSLVADLNANDAKARLFPPILKLMQMRVSRIEYAPWA